MKYIYNKKVNADKTELNKCALPHDRYFDKEKGWYKPEVGHLLHLGHAA